MHTMTEQQWRAFVLEGTRTGKLATTRADGRPHVMPVWFTLDGDHVVFNTDAPTVKARNLRRDARFALCVDDEHPPFAFVVLECTAEIVEPGRDSRHWAAVIGGRYMGEDRAQEFGERNGGDLLIRGRINKVIAQGDLAD